MMMLRIYSSKKKKVASIILIEQTLDQRLIKFFILKIYIYNKGDKMIIVIYFLILNTYYLIFKEQHLIKKMVNLIWIFSK